MTLRKRGNTWLVRLSQTAALAVHQVLRWATEGSCGRVGEAYLLHPRCCRSEHF